MYSFLCVESLFTFKKNSVRLSFFRDRSGLAKCHIAPSATWRKLANCQISTSACRTLFANCPNLRSAWTQVVQNFFKYSDTPTRPVPFFSRLILILNISLREFQLILTPSTSLSETKTSEIAVNSSQGLRVNSQNWPN